VKIGDYEVLGELGRGARSVVYRVRTPRGEECALKVLPQADGQAFTAFDRERRLLGLLGETDGFVGLLDAGKSSSGPWLLMPLVPGGTLRERLRRGALGVEETVALGVALASALGRAHARGVVHRDMKPENVLFTASGLPLVADLGLAKHFDRGAPGASQSVDITVEGVLKGTAGYAAPEQMRDGASAGPAADTYALGAVLYECLSGRPAFAGGSVVEMLARAASATVEPLATPGVPMWLDGVVLKALAHDPAARYRDGASFARALGGPGASERKPRLALLLTLGLILAVAVGGVVGGTLLARGPSPVALPPEPPPATRPTPPPPTPDETARALVTLSLAKRDARQLQEAFAFATQAIELAPGLAPAWQARAHVRSDLSDWQGVEADLTRAIEDDPHKCDYWVGRGHARLVTGDIEGSIADLTRGVELDPSHFGAWADRGLARARTRDLDGAIADESTALTLAPEQAWIWARRGNLRLARNDVPGGVSDLERALELDPDLPDAASLRTLLENARRRRR
jgi:serine/threonine-protein kinase